MDTQQAMQVERDHAVDPELGTAANQPKGPARAMVKMISLRSFLLSTKTGHMVRFHANVPKNVPHDAVPEAMEKGCVPTNKADAPFFEDLKRSKAEFAGNLRRSIILSAIKVLVDENNSKNFDGGGLPKVEVLCDRVGFDVNKAERLSLFQEFMAAKWTGVDLELHADTDLVRMIVSASNRKELTALLPQTGITSEQAKGLQMTELRKLMLSNFALAQR